MKFVGRGLAVAVALMLSGCAGELPQQVVEPTETWFTDVTAAAGLATERTPDRTMKHILESTGSGVTVGDYDGDGDDDLFFPSQPTIADVLAGREGPPNRLYRNEGDGTFVEVAESAGVAHSSWANAGYFVDYDNDGDRDLFVVAWGPNTLYRNRGDGTFEDATAEAGVAGPADAWSTAAAFADLDLDGFLDLFVVNYCKYDPADPPRSGVLPTWRGLDVFVGPKGLPGQYDQLYRNVGDGSFEDISVAAGLHDGPPLYGLGVVMQDLDDDIDIDIYVANDSVVNQLWRNDGHMPLVEVATLSGTATNENAKEQAGMGVDVADVNDDDRFDLFVTNFSHDWNTLYLNAGGLRYRDATFESGLSESFPYMGWGTKLFDFDHDGRLDIAIANGHIYPEVDRRPELGSSFKQPNELLRRTADGRYERVPDPVWQVAETSRGLALLDYDGDGDLDVALSHLDAPPTLLRNEAGDRGHWIMFRLQGTRSNRDGIGVQFELEMGDRTLTRAVQPFGSFQSQSTLAVHVGLGEREFVDLVRVRWPAGRTYEYPDLQADRVYTLVERTGITTVELPREGAE